VVFDHENMSYDTCVKIYRFFRYHTIRVFQVLLWLVSQAVVGLSKTDINKQTTVTKTHSAMVISNHVSLRDSMFFVGSLSWNEFRSLPPLRAITAKWYYHSPLLPVLYLIGCYPARPLVKPLKPYAGVAAAVRFMQQGYSIGIYPEGQRAQKSRIPARGGVVRMLTGHTPDAIYLCKISHDAGRYRITIDQDNAVSRLKNADKIMDRVYALEP
jgi:1-acyl-sn-glycerol-3-phosphate acyltransferase